ncbi:nitrogen regulation protein NR(II) [Candidatus Omnitrophota bacterium]
MEVDTRSKEALIRKYRLAGKIRFISFSLLFSFLLLMKSVGGYSYLNVSFIVLIFVGAVLNQPYNFIVRRVNIHRLQYFQMTIDIIVISWILYYMGGIEAPLVSIGYYAIILWAGVVSTTQAVFFAVGVSALLFSSIAILEYFGLLPFISFYDYKMPTAQMASLLIANVSFLFAFGYFSANSSRVMQFLQRKKQDESLRSTHKLLAAGNLLGSTAHDMLNCLFCIKNSTKILSDAPNLSTEETKVMLKIIKEQEQRASNMLSRLAKFSKELAGGFEPIDIHKAIEDAIELVRPLTRHANMTIEKMFETNIPLIIGNKDQFQEVFMVIILNALDAISNQGNLKIRTRHLKEDNMVEIGFSDTGKGIRRDDLKLIGEPFFTTKDPPEGSGLGLATAYGIIARYNGKINVESAIGKGATFTVNLPIAQPSQVSAPVK